MFALVLAEACTSESFDDKASHDYTLIGVEISSRGADRHRSLSFIFIMNIPTMIALNLSMKIRRRYIFSPIKLTFRLCYRADRSLSLSLGLLLELSVM